MPNPTQPSFKEDKNVSIVLMERNTLLPRYKVNRMTLETTRITILGLYGVFTILVLLTGLKHAFIRISRELPFWVFFLCSIYFYLSLFKTKGKNTKNLIAGYFQAVWTLSFVNLLILITFVIPFINVFNDPFFMFHITISVFIFITTTIDFVMNRLPLQNLISILIIMLFAFLYGIYILLTDPIKVMETVSIFCYNRNKVIILTGLYIFTSLFVWQLYSLLFRLKHRIMTTKEKEIVFETEMVQKNI